MKHSLFLGLTIALFVFNINFANSRDTAGPAKKNLAQEAQAVNNISDLVLMYDGGLHRKAWTIDRLRPYLYRENNGKTEFIFDGFLFLEIFDDKKNVEYYPGFKKNPAQKADWQALLDTYFDSQKSLGGIETILDELAKQNITPLRKRKIVISVPTPIKGFTKWGETDGKTLDFNKADDQFAAVKWFIDEALNQWKAKDYKNIKLTGFYWVTEDCGTNYAEVVRLTRQYVAKQGKTLCWIPYFKAGGGERWKEWGFDFAYEQPNYFFSTSIPFSRIDDACAFGKKYGLGMEMEFDYRVAKPEFRSRFYDYLKGFKANKVWKTCPVAYYEGGGTWGDMAKSNDPEMKKMYKTLADIIIKRQAKADRQSIIKNPE